MGTDEAKQRLKECPPLMQYFKEFFYSIFTVLFSFYDWLFVSCYTTIHFVSLICLMYHNI
jgi:hypothetical protein